MNEPRRWMEGGDEASLEELSLLSAARAARMPKELRHAVWQTLAAVPIVASADGGSTDVDPRGGQADVGDEAALKVNDAPELASTGGAGKAAGVAVNFSLRKGLLTLVMSGGAVGLGAFAWPTSSHVESAPVASVSAAAGAPAVNVAQPGAAAALVNAPRATMHHDLVESSSPERGRDRVRGQTARVSRSVDRSEVAQRAMRNGETLPLATMAQTAPSPLQIEAEAVGRARRLLRDGRARDALAALDELERDLRRGSMSEERALLRLRALRSLGRAAATRRKARVFLESYPRSVYADEVRLLAH